MHVSVATVLTATRKCLELIFFLFCSKERLFKGMLEEWGAAAKIFRVAITRDPEVKKESNETKLNQKQTVA